MSKKLDILKEVIFGGKTLRDYRPYDCGSNMNSLDMWVTRETYDSKYSEHARMMYKVFIQRPLSDVEEYGYSNLWCMYNEIFGIESDLGYSLNNEGRFELL